VPTAVYDEELWVLDIVEVTAHGRDGRPSTETSHKHKYCNKGGIKAIMVQDQNLMVNFK